MQKKGGKWKHNSPIYFHSTERLLPAGLLWAFKSTEMEAGVDFPGFLHPCCTEQGKASLILFIPAHYATLVLLKFSLTDSIFNSTRD